MVLTTSSLFLHTLAQVGISHVFVNWGSDHPAMLEELERQRAAYGAHALVIVTSPNEMVALSAAHAYAQVTGKPAAVIVHVDVGTQALAGAIHNADKSRVPILIYAGASPFTSEGELQGSRNEWIHWMQDVPDQPAIVRQYMRYTAQIASPANLPHQVRRALQIATSEPKGPVYLWARRETMEQEIDSSLLEQTITLTKWPSVQPTALPTSAVQQIANALLGATSPLLITSYLGRNHQALPALATLSRILALPVFLTCPLVTNLPISHPYLVGLSYLFPGTQTPLLKSADVVLVIDAEVAWIPMNKDKDGVHERPSEAAQIYVIDSGDPLRRGIGMHHLEADLVCHADAAVALTQLREAIGTRSANEWSKRTEQIQEIHHDWKAQLLVAESFPIAPPGSGPPPAYTTPQIVSTLRKTIRERGIARESVLTLNESISNFPLVWPHMLPEVAGEIIGSGGSALGWALGAGIGSVLGGRVAKQGRANTGYELVTAIVGDGTYLFGVPASAFWMARRYQTPFLTIVLNNGGWKSPKLSMLGVHPTGHGSDAVGDQLTVGFGPDCPDYSQIAVAASNGWAWGRKISVDLATEDKSAEVLLQETIAEAVRVVVEDRWCAVVDCVLESI
ncbi:thiamine pyrophosphate enzyme, N-terminal TPP binding domain-containing protein [Boletus coccyginus]|nr:thiamine pyrophosphate enzyme, N-terminal TPP binding domain-containing protein [Boletus coccyginus]